MTYNPEPEWNTPSRYPVVGTWLSEPVLATATSATLYREIRQCLGLAGAVSRPALGWIIPQCFISLQQKLADYPGGNIPEIGVIITGLNYYDVQRVEEEKVQIKVKVKVLKYVRYFGRVGFIRDKARLLQKSCFGSLIMSYTKKIRYQSTAGKKTEKIL
ncbi:hypothetical protein KQX54_007787 [Cotesia glomerata]|uniref:Uncharacterized protein n=1 Tax=Cotesia glomerata TaxID=32391 RepID=A0AAV7J0M5_COTGL|nr:hypothetical protein KQX54_007787 [Cotesia glomerata]